MATGSTPDAGASALIGVPPLSNRPLLQSYDRRSFLLALPVGKIWSDYNRAFTDNPRRAFLSLGDYLWRLRQAWMKARDLEEQVRVATEVQFKLVDLKKAKTDLDLDAIKKEYDLIRNELRPVFSRDCTPAERRLALYKIIPKEKHSMIWEYDGLGKSSEIAMRVVAEKHGYKPSTLKRLFSQSKKFSIEEFHRRAWLQQFNVASPPPPLTPAELPNYFLNVLLPALPSMQHDPHSSPIPRFLLVK